MLTNKYAQVCGKIALSYFVSGNWDKGYGAGG